MSKLYLFDGRVYSTAQMVRFCAAFGVTRTEAEIDAAEPTNKIHQLIYFSEPSTRSLSARRLTDKEAEEYYGNREALTAFFGDKSRYWLIDKLLEVSDRLRPFHLDKEGLYELEERGSSCDERIESALDAIDDSRMPLWP